MGQMNNIATNRSSSELTRLSTAAVVTVLDAPMAAGDVLARVTQSAQSSVEGALHKLQFRAMSTHCQVNCHGVSAATANDFQHDVVAWVAQFEARYSRFIPDSLVGRINAAAGEHWVETDPETDRLFNLCQELFFFTRG
jgi:FAD:protein FMN transferase